MTISGTATDAGGGVVGGVEVSVDGGTTWHPAAGRASWSYGWTPGASGPVTIRSRAVDDSGNLETPSAGVTVTVGGRVLVHRWLHASGRARAVPGTVDGGPDSAVELGVKFRSDVAGNITGIRFYKASTNTGHARRATCGRARGTLLASATFAGETASGWQQVSFAHAGGHHRQHGLRGLVPHQRRPLQRRRQLLLEQRRGQPAAARAGRRRVGCERRVRLRREQRLPEPGLHRLQLLGGRGLQHGPDGLADGHAHGDLDGDHRSPRDLDGDGDGDADRDRRRRRGLRPPTQTATPPATATRTATTTPSATGTRTASATPTVTPSPITGAITIWGPTATPATPADPDASAVELGVKFTSDVNGQITGIRFYKGTTNTGTHTGTLWSNAGTQLATATFANETASGWQQVNFAAPVAITAGTVYIASYHTTTGHYAGDTGYFAAAGLDHPPLHALRDGVSGGNGVYVYGARAFPTSTYQSSNYWVDVVFSQPTTATATSTATTGASATATTASTATATATRTPSGTSTATTAPSATSSATTAPSPTSTATEATATSTVTSTVTRTPTGTSTATTAPSVTSTATTAPSPTSTATATSTATTGASATATETTAPTGTATASRTLTGTSTATTEPSATATATIAPSPTSTATTEPSATPTGTTTATTTATPTPTVTATESATATPTATATVTNSSTPTTTAAPPLTATPTQTPANSLVIDVSVSADGINAVTTASFSTMLPGELLLAFVASDGPKSAAQRATVSGAGLTWTLVVRASSQLGTSEIWQATAASPVTGSVTSTPTRKGYDQSLTVVAIQASAGVGASAAAGAGSGAPTASLVTTEAGSLAFGVGNDWDNAVARTLGANQVVQHQWVDARVGDTFWVQRILGSTGPAGSVVTLNDTAPTDDRWNFAAVEVTGATPP